MTTSDFWDSTPREVMQVIDGATERYRRQRRLATTQAYYAGAIARSGGTLPDYADMFPEPTADLPIEAAAAGQLAMWESLAAANPQEATAP